MFRIAGILLLLTTEALGQFVNLPDAAPGVFNVSTRLELRTTTRAVWDVLTNFPAYAEWNPFVRSVWSIFLNSPLSLTP